MNKASTKAFKIMNYYLNHNKSVIKDFRVNYIPLPLDFGNLRIFTHNELRNTYGNALSTNTHQTNDTPDTRKLHFKRVIKSNKKEEQNLRKDFKQFMNIGNNKKSQDKHYNLIAYIQNIIIPKTHGNDLIILNTNYTLSKPQQRCRIFTLKDIVPLKHALLDFLTEDTEVKSRIKWILQNKPVSDYRFGKTIHITPSQITKYRNGNLKIGNMTIDNGEKIDRYYMNYVGNKLVGHNVILSAHDINQMFK